MISTLQSVGRKLSIFERIEKFRRKSREADSDEAFTSSTATYVPHDLLKLTKSSQLSRKEICTLYKEFKQICPNGSVNEDQFKELFGKFFPPNPSDYARHVFRNFGSRKNGAIRFQDLLVDLSSLSKGTLEDKLKWIFRLYDVNKDGCVTKEEMKEILRSIHALLGYVEGPSELFFTKRVDDIFKKFNTKKEGILKEKEFLEYCIKNEDIARSMTYLDIHW